MILAFGAVAAVAGDGNNGFRAVADKILAETGVRGGLIVHLGCGDGKLTAALKLNEAYRVHGLDADERNVAAAREHALSLGLYGSVAADALRSSRLPHTDGMVNLLVAEDLGGIPQAEV
ncbi:MAG: class I SAM-dependent methyltransferase [Verrucomicrobiota bacterium]|nr:class I SAM-dependent methyltransferase [Verrucomicrobiota bacterium]